MNVMAKAHKMTKAEIRHQSEVDPRGEIEWMSYPQILKIMLRRCHAEFKAMQAQVSYFDKVTVGLNTHQLAEGDIVRSHNGVFRLINRKDWPREANESDAQGHCVTFDTELVEFKEGNMPRHWANHWTIQGNKLAFWAVVVKA